MSYILDALRKSESERHQGEVPNLGANPLLIHASRDERPLWPYILIAVLVLNAIVVAVWLLKFQPDSATAKHAGAESPSTAGLGAVSPPQPVGVANPAQSYQTVTQAASAPTMSQPMPGAIPGLATEPATIPSTVQPVGPAQYNSSVSPQQQPGVTGYGQYQLPPAPSQPPANYTINPNTGLAEPIAPPEMVITPETARRALAYNEQLGYMDDTAPVETIPANPVESLSTLSPDTPAIDVPRLEEMPPPFRAGVPTLRFNSHIFSSDPTARRVMINNIYLREGQPFAGMVVQEITEGGVIMVKDGVMFEVSAARDWVNE